MSLVNIKVIVNSKFMGKQRTLKKKSTCFPPPPIVFCKGALQFQIEQRGCAGSWINGRVWYKSSFIPSNRDASGFIADFLPSAVHGFPVTHFTDLRYI